MSDKVVGSIPLGYTTLGVSLIIMGTCVVNYLICTHQETCEPWPNSTITECSTMYPNNVLFRFFLLMPSVVILIMFSAISGYLKHQASFLLGSFTVSPWIYRLGIIGFPFFVLAISTIDQGVMADNLHVLGAVVFFLLWDMSCWTIFFTMFQIFKKNPLLIKATSLIIKLACCLYQWVYFVQLIVKLLQPTDPETDGDIDPIVVKIEWGLMFTLLIFIGSFYFEFKDVYIQLDENYSFVFQNIQDKKDKLEDIKKSYQEKLQKRKSAYRLPEKLQQQQPLSDDSTQMTENIIDLQ